MSEAPDLSAPGVRLREATGTDIPVLARLERQLFPDEAWSAEQLAAEIGHPDRFYVVAEAAEPGGAHSTADADSSSGHPSPGDSSPGAPVILGYAGVMVSADLADIHTIGTTHPGRGIGRMLLSWLESRARDAGAERMLLEVREDNARARAIYERAGYRAIDRRRGYYRTAAGPVDAIIMLRDLDGT